MEKKWKNLNLIGLVIGIIAIITMICIGIEIVFKSNPRNIVEGTETFQNTVIENTQNVHISKLDYIEISVENENSTNGIEYTTPIKVEDKNVMQKITDIINNGKRYTTFEKDYGAGGFLEGMPIVTLYFKDGTISTMIPCDNFSTEKNTSTINFVSIYSKVDKTDEKTYILTEELSKYIQELYEEEANETKSSGDVKVNEELEVFLKHVAYLNVEQDEGFIGIKKQGVKLDIASYYSELYETEIGMASYKKDDINTSMIEIFGENVDIFVEGAYGLKYDSKTDCFSYEAGGDGSCTTYIVKIENQTYTNGIYEITYLYAYPSDGDIISNNLDNFNCYRTTVKIKENTNYKNSKYQLVNVDSISSKRAGKIVDFK